MSSPLIIFTHIPRAGGTSMWRVFRSVYGKRVKRVAGKGTIKTREIVAQLLKDKPEAYDVIGGHVRYGIGENCVSRSYKYFTVLRDPTEVALSRYHKRTDPVIQKRKAARKVGDLEENLTRIQNKFKIRLEDFIRNDSNPFLKFLIDYEEEAEGNLTRKHLEIAKNRLKNDYLGFCFVERYQESLELLAKAFEWKYIPAVERRNAGRNRPSESHADLMKLGREVNALDYELYDFAEKLFDERLAALGV